MANEYAPLLTEAELADLQLISVNRHLDEQLARLFVEHAQFKDVLQALLSCQGDGLSTAKWRLAKAVLRA